VRVGSWLTLGAAVVVVLCSTPSSSGAQTVGAGGVLQSYRFADADAAGLESIQLITMPFAVAVPIGSLLSLQASGAYAIGTATAPNGEQVKLTGPTDTHIGLSVGVGLDWLVVTVRASLPTGASTYTAGESLVASVVAAELLPFAISTWGSGGSVGATVAVVTQAGGWGVGFAGGYNVASEYEPLQDQQLGYRPGDQLQARLALDHDVGGSGTLSILLGFQNFGNDQIGGGDLFRSGNRLEGTFTYAFAVGRRSSALLFGGVSHRANGSLLDPSSSLGAATDSPAQQLFRFGTNVRLPIGRRAALLPTLEARVFRAEDGASQGWMTTAGASLDVRIAGGPSGQRLVLAPSARMRLGRVIVSEGLETGVTGWEAGLTLRAVLGR